MPSTVIASFSYNEEKAILKVSFTSGKIYEYLEVPVKIYKEMKASFSKGIYFNEQVKGHYKFKKCE